MILVWFRQDLRLSDNPALHFACRRKVPILPLYILDDKTPGKWAMGSASRWWLHHSLEMLDERLKERGARLVLAKGDPLEILPRLVKKHRIEEVCWNRCYEPYARALEKKLEKVLPVSSFKGSLLFEPEEICNQQGEPYKVFTPFWKRCMQLSAAIDKPLSIPRRIEGAKVGGEKLAALKLLPDWPCHFTWKVGESAAKERLKKFTAKNLERYAQGRDRPDLDVTSKLSPHLHFGEISPKQLFHAAMGKRTFLSELGWREFSTHQLVLFPQLPDRPWKKEFGRFPWNKNAPHLHAWQRGETGFPIVDAGMRQLWQTGWMHNRVRMIVASFLIKDLLIHWREGERFFWDTLVDADLANNSASWQWVAGCGFDAAPFFRIFNPTLQGEKFDPEGTYVKRWVPELKNVPARWVHTPLAYDETLAYPEPIVDHSTAREVALKLFSKVRQQA